MADIERLAASDDNALCNQADMNFQHALAEASGLTRIGPMLQILGQQVRMFIAVVGINYAFPIEPVVERNRAILAAIDKGDEELAAQRWREKIRRGSRLHARTGRIRAGRPAGCHETEPRDVAMSRR